MKTKVVIYIDSDLVFVDSKGQGTALLSAGACVWEANPLLCNITTYIPDFYV